MTWYLVIYTFYNYNKVKVFQDWQWVVQYHLSNLVLYCIEFLRLLKKYKCGKAPLEQGLEPASSLRNAHNRSRFRNRHTLFQFHKWTWVNIPFPNLDYHKFLRHSSYLQIERQNLWNKLISYWIEIEARPKSVFIQTKTKRRTP